MIGVRDLKNNAQIPGSRSGQWCIVLTCVILGGMVASTAIKGTVFSGPTATWIEIAFYVLSCAAVATALRRVQQATAMGIALAATVTAAILVAVGDLFVSDTVMAFVTRPALAISVGAQIGLVGRLSQKNGGLPALPSRSEAAKRIDLEVYRARRFERPISLVAVPLVVDARDHTQLGRQVLYGRRQSDFAFLEADGRLMVLACPDTDHDGAELAARRLVAALSSDALAGPPRIATMPEEALTFEGLLDTVRTPGVTRACVSPMEPAAS